MSYPVVLTEAPGHSILGRLGPWERLGALEKAVGAVDSVRQLPSGKWLIGCADERQQNFLSRTTTLPGGIRFQARMPIPTVEGVIGPIPPGEEALRRVKQDLTIKYRVAAVTRLKTARGTEGRAIKVTFEATELPLEVWIARTSFQVVAYAASVRRCTHCQLLGHTKAQCRSRLARCSNCGRGDHKAADCTQLSSCINCVGRHSAAWKSCPEVLIRAQANLIRSRTYMPYSVALQQARKELFPPQKSAEESRGAGSPAPRAAAGWAAEAPRRAAGPAARFPSRPLDHRSFSDVVVGGPRGRPNCPSSDGQGGARAPDLAAAGGERNKDQPSRPPKIAKKNFNEKVKKSNHPVPGGGDKATTPAPITKTRGEKSPRNPINHTQDRTEVGGQEGAQRGVGTGPGGSPVRPSGSSARRSLGNILRDEASREVDSQVPRSLRDAVFELFWALAEVRRGKDPQVLLGVVSRLLNWPQGQELRYSQTMDLMFVMAGLRDDLAPGSTDLPLHY